jgi:hypothetical protein
MKTEEKRAVARVKKGFLLKRNTGEQPGRVLLALLETGRAWRKV